MAAVGGDTVIPTNWTGMIVVTIIVAIVAAATYYGMEMEFGKSNKAKPVSEESLSVQEVFSASAKREVAAAEPVRALSRADLSAEDDDDANSDWADSDDDTASDDMNNTVAAAPAASTQDDDSDWESSSDDWDTQPAPTAAPTAKPAPVAQPKPAAPKPSAAPVAAAKPAAAPAPAVVAAPINARKRPSADALTAWWVNSANSALSVRFAGTLDRGNKASDGIAVMFSSPVAPAQAAQNMQLKSAAGSAVNANWKTGANPNVLILEGLAEGRYELAIKAGLAAANGQSLNKAVSGPVFVY